MPYHTLALLSPSGFKRFPEQYLPETTPQNGTRQAVMIANVLLEGRERMGLDLGPEIEEALAKDALECAEAANIKRKTATAV